MDIPEELFYTREHEWAKIDEKAGIATFGITDYAQDKLGDIVYLELPEEGAQIQMEEPCGSVESVKAVSDIFAPVTGKVLEVNDSLLDAPETVNDDPYGEAWMVKVSVKDKSALKGLMSAKAYKEFVESQEE